jgi:hypothetical protein
VRANVHGIGSTSDKLWTDDDLQADPIVTRYLLWFSDQADAAARRLHFG